jgi:hypothetical protein
LGVESTGVGTTAITLNGMASTDKAKARDRWEANAVQYLQPGEQIHALFPAETRNPYLARFDRALVTIFSKAGLTFESTGDSRRVVVVTDRRILVCRVGRWRTFALEAVLRELPRQTQIGPANGLYYSTEAFGERLYIHRAYFHDIALVDS